MEEDIKILEEFKKSIKNFNNYADNTNVSLITKRQVKAIENLIARYKEVKKENKKMKANNLLKLNKEINENIQVAYGGRRYNTEGIVIENYILKSKVKEKIEELNKEFNERNSKEEDFNYNYGEEYAFAEEKLKELLED